MNTTDFLTVGVSALLSGGGITSWWRAHKTVPAERDSLIVNGAEAAVAGLDKYADRIERDNTRLRAENDELQRMVSTLQRKLDDLREQLMSALEGANDAHAKLAALQEQINRNRSDG